MSCDNLLSLLLAGLVTQLPQEFFNFLLEVQNKLAKIIKSVGKIDHSLYPLLLNCYLGQFYWRYASGK